MAAVAAMFIRDWRQLGLVTTASAIVTGTLCALTVTESPRWLVFNRNFAKADKILKLRAASKKVPPIDIHTLQNIYRRHAESTPDALLSNSKTATPIQQVVQLLSERRLRVRSLMFCVDWIVITFVYYGTTYYGVGAIPGESPMVLFGVMSFGCACAYPFYLGIFNKLSCRTTMLISLPVITVLMLILGLVPLRSLPAGSVLFAGFYVTAYVLSDLSFCALYIITYV